MQKIRYWAFPTGLALAWILSSVYTIHSLVDAHNAYQVFQQAPAASSAPEMAKLSRHEIVTAVRSPAPSGG